MGFSLCYVPATYARVMKVKLENGLSFFGRYTGSGSYFPGAPCNAGRSFISVQGEWS